jgi:Protein of unknown function (DUF998)
MISVWRRLPDMPSSQRDRICARLGLVGVIAFVAIVAIEHAINSALDPATHEISEYVHGHVGPLMTVGFVCWAVSLTATGWLVLQRVGARLLAAALGIASGGIVLAASFATETSAGRLPPGKVLTATGRLHDVGSGLATVALLIAALVSLYAVAEHAFRRNAALLVAVAVSSDIALLAIGSSVAGARQRVLVASACAWQLLLLRAVARHEPKSTPVPAEHLAASKR